MPYQDEVDVVALREKLNALGLSEKGKISNYRQALANLAATSAASIDNVMRPERPMTEELYQKVLQAVPLLELAIEVHQLLQPLGHTEVNDLIEASGVDGSIIRSFAARIQVLPSAEQLKNLRSGLALLNESFETEEVDESDEPGDAPDTALVPVEDSNNDMAIEVDAGEPEEVSIEMIIISEPDPLAEIVADQEATVEPTDETLDQPDDIESETNQALLANKVRDNDDELLADDDGDNQFLEESSSSSASDWPRTTTSTDESADLIPAALAASNEQETDMSQADTVPGFGITSRPPQEAILKTEESQPTEGQQLANMLAHVAQLAEAGGPHSRVTFEAKVGPRTIKVDIGE